MIMRTEHLTPDELEAFSRGEDTEPSVGVHLKICEACREAARETEFGTHYLRPLAGDHPDEDVLTAFWSHALPPSREHELRSHVATCSRCRSLLARLERATPIRSHPDLVSETIVSYAVTRAIAATGPRRATLVVRAAEGLKWLLTTFDPVAAPLRHGGLRPEPSVRRLDRLADVASVVARAEDRYRPEPSILNDSQRAFCFASRREGATIRLLVGFFGTMAPGDTAEIDITFDSPGRPTQRIALTPGSDVSFEIFPGTSHLSIAVRPSWEIEIHLDA